MRRLLALAALALASAPAGAAPIVLTFEGVGNNQPVGNYYGGGAGPNYGITFGSSALGLVDSDAGGSGNFANEPSPDTILYFASGNGAVMNVPAGFTTGFSFFYTAAVSPGSVSVYDGLNGTGNLLATLVLPVTPPGPGDPNGGTFGTFSPIGVTFAGTARSVNFGGAADGIGFDDVTIGSPAPGIVPEPATLGACALMGFASFGYIRRRLKGQVLTVA